MTLGSKGSTWRSLVGVFGVAVLALGVSLKLEGAPPGSRVERAEDKAAKELARPTLTQKEEALNLSPAPSPAPVKSSSRVTVGSIPGTGVRPVSTSYVDYRNDEGTRLREAGKLIGPMPLPSPS